MCDGKDQVAMCPGCGAELRRETRPSTGDRKYRLWAEHDDGCALKGDRIFNTIWPSPASRARDVVAWLSVVVKAVDECVRQGPEETRQEVGLLVVRGLPGSGKSTLGGELTGEGWLHYEPDHLFRDCGGRYRWDAQLWEQAEWFTRAMADRALARGERVVVTDVLPRAVDVDGYVKLARAHGRKARVVCARREFGSVHRVPVYVVERMREAWEDWVGEEVVTE